MTRFYLCCLTLLAPLLSFGGNAILQGKITNRISDTVIVTYTNNPISYTEAVSTAILKKDGTFSISIAVPRAFTECKLHYGADYAALILSPNNELDLTLNGADFPNSLHYTGKDSAQANFVARHAREHERLFSTRKKTAALSKVAVDQIDSAVNADMQAEFNYLEQYGKRLSPAFRQFWQMNFRYIGYTLLLEYPFSRFSYLKNQNPQIAIKRDDRNLDHVPDAFNDELVANFAYQRYVYKYVNMKWMLHSANIDSIVRLIYQQMPAQTAAYAGAWLIYHTLSLKKEAPTALLVQDYKTRFPTSPYLALLEEASRTKELLAPGKPAIDFSFTTVDGKALKLSELKGNVVVIDFWASWCAPCISKLPESKKVETHFASKPVVFLYISLDEDKAQWKTAIAKHDIIALHTLAEPGALNKQYNVVGIPTSFLIDKNGNFVAEPETNDALIAKIEELIQ